MKKKEELCSLQGNQQSAVSFMAKLHELHEFKGHPFKVENDRTLFELMKSVEENGVLVPLIVRILICIPIVWVQETRCRPYVQRVRNGRIKCTRVPY